MYYLGIIFYTIIILWIGYYIGWKRGGKNSEYVAIENAVLRTKLNNLLTGEVI